MKLAGVGMTLYGAEGAKSPPLRFIEVDDKEGNTLLALYPKKVLRLDAPADEAEAPEVPVAEGDAVAVVNGDGTATPAVIVDGEPVATGEATIVLDPEATPPAPAAEDAPAAPAPAPAEESEAIDAAEASRLAGGEHPADLVEAFDLLEDDDLVKTGDRAGRPKVDAIKAILDRDVTATEIDAAWAARVTAAA